jgi:hypothetical protein
MAPRFVLATILAFAAVLWCASFPAGAQTASPIAGVWTLNRTLSEFPKEIGFGLDLSSVADPDSQSASPTGGRGRRRSGGGARTSARPAAPRRESYEDGQRMRILLGEVRNPPVRLIIVDTPATVTITNELGQSRRLHPTGKDEVIEIENVTAVVTTKRDGDRLVVLYHVEQDRDVRWTYSSSQSSSSGANAMKLVVEAQLLEGGSGDKATRVYEAGTGPEVAASPARPAGAPASASQPEPDSFDQRPGAEFAGLKSLGILVEDFGAEALACGLRHDAIEEALSKRLAAGGLAVRKNSDEDTYVYVNVITTGVANGTCVSRYDAFLYTHGTTKLAYRDRPVLVQVSLMHRGGIGASAASAHQAAVLRGLEGYVDLFVTQIRDANK